MCLRKTATLVNITVCIVIIEILTIKKSNFCVVHDWKELLTRGGVEDTRLEAKAKAKDTKKIRGQGQGQGQPFRGQNLSRPRTGMLEAKAKDRGHRRKCSQKKVFKNFFQASLAYPEFLIGVSQNHKSHEMTSSKFFQRGSFCGTKISSDGRSEIAACWHVIRILQRERA